MAEPTDFEPRPREVLTPSRLNALARELVEQRFPSIWVEGELSNVSRPASGHLYFTLKDAQAQVRCAMFRLRAGWLRFRPADGQHVLVRARVSLYEARGEFQLLVEHMEEAGEGALRREFERLKARLAAEGLFESARKRPLPRLARRIAILTSPSGAAIRDVLSVLGRRFPLLAVDLLPIPVQGREAPPAIVAMIDAAVRCARYDVLLLARGGGSIEDLWAFNDERVARAIAAASIPVVSAIGHEIDFTIADFVADLRAPTPSAAAELMVPDRQDLARALEVLRRRLTAAFERRLRERAQRIDAASLRLRAQHPRQRLRALRERWRGGQQRLAATLQALLERRRARLGLARVRLEAAHPGRLLVRLGERAHRAEARLGQCMPALVAAARLRAEALARALHAVSPLATLERGYAIVQDAATAGVIRSAAQVSPGQALDVRVADGGFPVTVRPLPVEPRDEV
jgi:exodeoxyribonuclease VII large subunit